MTHLAVHLGNELEAKLNLLGQTNDFLRARAQSEIDGGQANYDELKLKHEELQNTLEHLTQETKELKKSVSALSANDAVLHQRVDELVDQLQHARKDLATLQAKNRNFVIVRSIVTCFLSKAARHVIPSKFSDLKSKAKPMYWKPTQLLASCGPRQTE